MMPINRSPLDDNLLHLVARLARSWTYLLCGLILGLGVGILLSCLVTPQYQATMIVAPAEYATQADQFAQSTGDGALSYKIPAQASSSNLLFTRFEQSLRGMRVAQLVHQMAGVTEMVRVDTVFRGFSHKIDSSEDLTAYLQNHIDMEPIGTSASLKITYRHPDPVFAVRLLTILRKADDQLIKNQDKDAALERIEWLKASLKTALNPEHRQAIVKLLTSEERRVMFLSQEAPYAVTVIDEAYASSQPVVPRPFLYSFIMTMTGLLLSIVVVILRDSIKGHEE